MATSYTINFTDVLSDEVNKQPFTIAPGEINVRTSLALPGQGAALYGEHVAEDFLHLLENFSSATPPSNATQGQLWYDSSSKLVKVLQQITTDGNGVKTYNWVPVGRILVSTTQPAETGSLWYDTSSADATQHQLKIYNQARAAWVSVADRYVLKAGDTMTGDLKFAAGEGVFGYTGVESNGIVNFVIPGTSRGPAILGSNHATVMISTNGSTGNSFVVSAGQSNIADADGATYAVMRVKDTGEVQIVRGNLNMTSQKVTNLSAGTVSSDAVNFGQLSAVQTQVADLTNNKVNRSGDTMSGALTIQTSGTQIGNGSAAGEGRFALVVKGTGTDSGGILVHALDDNGDEKGLEIVNTYGPGGSTQSVFSVRSFNGNTAIAGDVTLAKTLSVTGASAFTGAITVQTVSTMNVAASAIVNNRHLTTKEYVDAKVASVAITGDFAEINPISPNTGDIRVTGTGAALKMEVFGDGAWRQIWPAQWAD